MDLRSEKSFWLLKNGMGASSPSLDRDIKIPVAIIGAGISGALIGWHLSKAGVPVVIVDKRHAGMGSTSASTALLQYEIDTPLVSLSEMVGPEHAVRSYKLCLKAVDNLHRLCKYLKSPTAFELKDSFQYASYKNDVGKLREEFELRKANGIAVQWMEPKNIKQKWGFDAPAGILSSKGAQVDPYLLTHALLKDGKRRGLAAYDNTEIATITHQQKGVLLTTDQGHTIKAEHLIIACGYESQKYLNRKVASLQSTYAMISEPFSSGKFWYKNSLIWETATPYCYLRTTPDNRIIIGGKDDDFSNPVKRDESLPRKAKALQKVFHKLFPNLPFNVDYQWAGTFASTKDGLPYIGKVKEQPRTIFALGFGGNGITYSLIAARLIADMLTNKKNRDAELFRFNR